MRYSVSARFVNYKKGALDDSQPQVIKITSCLPMIGGSLRVLLRVTSSTTKTGRSDIAEILLKVALNTINHSVYHLMFLLSKL